MENIFELQEKMIHTIESSSENSLDLYYQLYTEFLKDCKDAAVLLRTIIEYPNRIGEENCQSTIVSEVVIQTIYEQYKKHIISTVAVLAKQNDTVECFYEKLWSAVFLSATSPSSEEELAVVLKIINEDCVLLPYYQAIDLISMDNDEFKKNLTSLEPAITEAIHMLNRHFLQKTEEASQLLRISQYLSEEKKCVYWSIILKLIKEATFRKCLAENRADSEKIEE